MSYIPANSNNDELFGDDKKQVLLKDQWNGVQQCKKEFLKGGSVDTQRYPYMKPEVIESWMRSRDFGVNPDTVEEKTNLNEEFIGKTLEEHKLLIDVTKSTIEPFKEMILACGHIFYLLNEQGFILWDEGNRDEFPQLFGCKSRMGILSNENSAGTTAHELCIRLKRPVQLIGPEHYCVAFQDSIASAVPIKEDEEGNLLGVLLLLSQPLKNPIKEENLKNECRYSLKLIASIAVAIETQYKLEKTFRKSASDSNKVNKINDHSSDKNERKMIHHLLDTTMDFIDEGVAIINPDGKIVHVNKKCLHILKRQPEEIIDKNINISQYIGNNFDMTSMVEKSAKAKQEECISVILDRKTYKVRIRAVFNQQAKNVDVMILRFSLAEKTETTAVSLAKHTFADIIGESKELKKVVTLAERFAKTHENILLIGESGTGKEVFAQAIHNVYRPDGPFVAVNCAALPRELIESELFGYEGGSFTGAERNGRVGKIEFANGGTLFLDEIGDMPLDIQAVLLRTIEDKQVMRIGGNRYKKVEFRLIAATNKDLYSLAREHQFREDLFFRLSVLNLTIPPLRERGKDIELMSKYFIEKYCSKQGAIIPQISAAAQKNINEYEWYGNVRQLQNAMIYAVNTVQDGCINIENLPSYIVSEKCSIKVDENTSNEMLYLKNLEKVAIETALLRANNYMPNAAEILGISRSTLYRKLKEYNIEI
ncbi:MAG: ArsR family transcriptional regulator [Firmicutes bacterium]|nr:ArsR family transcriptional regulator [Bacillota bacterium]